MTKPRDLATLGGGFTQSGTGAVQRSVESKLKDTVSVKDFGAVGDGVADDTAAIQTAITYASSSGKIVIIPAGIYRVSSILISNGIGGIYCEGTIKGFGTAVDATLVLGAAGAPVINASFTLKLDQSSGDLVAVKGYDTSGCSFVDCLIYGFTNSATTNHYAFWMVGPCNENVFVGNKITLVSNPIQRGFGIALYGTPGTALDYGGFFSGSLSRGQFPSVRNTICANVIDGGSYAINLQVAEFNSVTGNICNSQNHRSIYVAAGAYGNVIGSNSLIAFTSTAVLLGYNAVENIVSGNRCETTIIGGEAAININTGSSGNLVTGNSIDSPSNYGVYMGCDVRENTITSNDIRNYYLAGIALENDWKSPRPTNAIFSRPNYEGPPSPYTAWSQLNSTDNVIQGNILRNGYVGRNTASIAIAQIDGPNTTLVTNNIVSGNIVTSPDNIAYNLHLYADTDTRFSNLLLANNNFHSGNTFLNTTTSGATSWNPRISYYVSNKELNNILDSEAIVFTNGDTTPSVVINAGPSNNRIYDFSAYTSATTVTDFTNGYNGQVITLRLHPNVTIAYNSALIRTKGLTNITGSTNTLVQFRRISNVWFETWRNA